MALIISNVTVSTSSQNLTNVTVNATKSEYNNTTARDSIQNPDNTYLLEANGYISFILTSTSIFICLLVIIFAFKKNGKEYFKWKKSQRFIVVTAACDIMFYGVQLAFATDVTISGIVPSSSICSIYAVVLLEVAYAQCNLSMIIATTACFCILQQENLNFGKYDWKMFLCMFSYQAIILVIAAFNGGTDFNGIYCGLKEGTGVLWNFVLIFVFLAITLIVLSVLYFLIWYKIYTEGNKTRETLGNQSMSSKHIIVATRNMSFFILAFILRFTAPAVHGLWVFIDEQPPKLMYQIVTFATCIGGIFNGIIYLTIRREHL